MPMSSYPLDSQGRAIPDGSWPGRRAPARLESLRRFLNTTNRENTAELLDGPRAAQGWLEREGHPCPTRPGPSDVALLVDTRESLRALAGEPSAVDAVAALERIADRCPVVVRFQPVPTLAPTRRGVPGFVGEMLAVTHDAMIDGSWSRLKACHHCRWFFYDHSRNAAGRWCSTSACGGRLKARAYRARKKVAHA
jgi:predicted RNA-binding Zn ribbon-like protein